MHRAPARGVLAVHAMTNRSMRIRGFRSSAWELQTLRSVEQASNTLLRLNLETRAYHALADENWLALLREGITRLEYTRCLASIYGFEAPLEAALAYTPNLKLVIDLRGRFRAGLIVQDLLALGLRAGEITDLPQCLPMAPFRSPIEALGWIYVVERSTLLHDPVRRHIAGRLPEVGVASAYLSAYGGVAGARWSELGHILDRAAPTDDMVHDLVIAAHAGFRALIAWTHGRAGAHAHGI